MQNMHYMIPTKYTASCQNRVEVVMPDEELYSTIECYFACLKWTRQIAVLIKKPYFYGPAERNKETNQFL